MSKFTSLTKPSKTMIRRGMKMTGLRRGELERKLKIWGATIEDGGIVPLNWWLDREETKQRIRDDEADEREAARDFVGTFPISKEEQFYLDNPQAIGVI